MAKKKIQMKKKIQTKKKAQIKRKVQVKKPKEVKFIGKVAHVRQTKPAIVIDFPRSLNHVHTYGLLSPFFEGLTKGELRATRCPIG
jgi:hypothetical protein